MATINGTNSNDTLAGTTGADVITGLSGNDSLTGGTGNDIFAYVARNFGLDTITDFTQGQDQIDLSSLGIADMATLLPFISQSGTNTVISFYYFSTAESITIKNVLPAQLTAADFIFNASTNGFSVSGTYNQDVLFGGLGADTLSGDDRDDILTGGAGNDVLNGGDGDDALTGGTGNDIFAYKARNFGLDTIRDFTQGQDRIDLSSLGIADMATLLPFISQSGTNTVISFYYFSTAESITIKNVLPAQLTAADFIFNASTNGFSVSGTYNQDVLFGGLGADTLSGDDRDDILTGGAGNDVLNGGDGDDALTGGTGNDIFAYKARNFGLDTIRDFTQGQDQIDLSSLGIADMATLLPFLSQSGSNTVISFYRFSTTESITIKNVLPAQLTAADFIFNASTNGFSVSGTYNQDVLFGGLGADTLSGDDRDDILTGGAGNDVLNGGDGDDALTGGTGNDIFAYKARNFGLDTIRDFTQGQDQIDLSSLGIADMATLLPFISQSGTNTVISFYYFSTAESITIKNVLPAQLTAADFIFNASTNGFSVSGTYNQDVLFGGLGADTLSGDDRDDILTGGAGNDVLNGGDGDDALTGGTGNDIFAYKARNFGLDTIRDFTQGQDRIDLSSLGIADMATLLPFLSQSGSNTVISFYRFSTTESITIKNVLPAQLTAADFIFNASTNGFSVSGTYNQDVLFGGLGADTLSGDDRDDILTGGAGNDVLTGGSGADRFLFGTTLNANTNLDVVTDFVAGTDKLLLDNAVFSAFTTSGAVSASNFISGAGVTAAADGNDYLIYNTTTGALSYDADGNGTNSSPIQFATLSSKPALTVAGIEVQINTAVSATNHAPVLASAIPDQSWTEGEAKQYVVPADTFTDSDGQTLTYTAIQSSGSALPSWLSFNASTRTFSGTAPTGTADVTVRVTATDTGGLSTFDDVVFSTPAPTALFINASNSPQTEGNTGSTQYTFLVTRTGVTTGAASAAWSVSGTGTSPANATDFTGGAFPSGTVSFSAGQTTTTITVNVAGDTTFESNDAFTVTLSNPVGATLGTTSGTLLTETASGGVGVTEHVYTLGSGNGVFTLQYEMFTLPDRADIYVDGLLVTSTNGAVSGTGSLTIPGGVLLGAGTEVHVVVTGTDATTEWNYDVTYAGGVQSQNYIAYATIVNDDLATANRSPVLSAALVDQNWIEASPQSFVVPGGTFTDPDGNTLSYKAAQSSGSALPSWLSFDASTRTFSGTAPAGTPDVTVRVTATDSGGLSAFDDVVLFTPSNQNITNNTLFESNRYIGDIAWLAQYFGAQTSTSFEVLNGSGILRVSFVGTNFTYDSNGFFNGGTVTAEYFFSDAGQLTYVGTNLNIDVATRNSLLSVGTSSGAYGQYAARGDDAYTGSTGDDRFGGSPGINSFDGGAGIDLLSFIGYSQAVNINLLTGKVVTGSATSTVVNVEDIEGTDYADTLIGDANNNQIQGFGGADKIDGGAGFDTVVYFEASSAINVNLATGFVSGGGGNDTLNSIERVLGSRFNDVLTGSDANEFFLGGFGNDTINGAGGIDTIEYGFVGAAVVVNLTTGVVSGGGGNDVISNIESASGSVFDDSLTGNDADNVLDGGNGADTLDGGKGADLLIGGGSTDQGSNRLIGGAGNDILIAGGAKTQFLNTLLTQNPGIVTLLLTDPKWGKAQSFVKSDVDNSGGGAHNNFEFHAGSGNDNIYNFHVGSDKIQIDKGMNSSGVNDYNALLQHVTASGSYYVIDFGGGNTVTLVGVDAAGLTSGNFVFV